MTPAFEYSCDGLSLDPLEVMFVKVKSYMLGNDISYSKKAVKIQEWQQQVSWGGANSGGGGGGR